MPQNPPWRHHYIPEFYLKQWTDLTGRLVEYSRPWGRTVKPKRSYPRQTGFEDRLNELDGLPEHARQALETQFYSPVDSAAASVLHALKAGRREFTQRETLAWARFLTSLLVRNPENVKAATERLIESIHRVDPATERRYQVERRPDDPPTFKDFLKQMDLADELSRSAKEVVASIIDNGLVVTTISGMHWGVCTFRFLPRQC